jgi:hypothetical protein
MPLDHIHELSGEDGLVVILPDVGILWHNESIGAGRPLGYLVVVSSVPSLAILIDLHDECTIRGICYGGELGDEQRTGVRRERIMIFCSVVDDAVLNHPLQVFIF